MQGEQKRAIPDWQVKVRVWSTVALAVLLTEPLDGFDRPAHVI